MYECADQACEQVLSRVVYSVIGESPSDCKGIEAVHWGNPQKGFQRGQSELIIKMAARVVVKAVYASIAHSTNVALLALQEGQSVTQAYQQV